MLDKTKMFLVLFIGALCVTPSLAEEEVPRLIEVIMSCSKDKSGKSAFEDDYIGFITSNSFSSTKSIGDPKNKKGGIITLLYGDLRETEASVKGYGTRYKSKYKWPLEFKLKDVKSMEAALFSGMPGFENKGDAQHERKCTLKAKYPDTDFDDVRSLLKDAKDGKRLPSIIDKYTAELKIARDKAEEAAAKAKELDDASQSLQRQIIAEKDLSALLRSEIQSSKKLAEKFKAQLEPLRKESNKQKVAAEKALAELNKAKAQPEMISEMKKKVAELLNGEEKNILEISSLRKVRESLTDKLKEAEASVADKVAALAALQDELKTKEALKLKILDLETKLADSVVGSKQLGALATTISDLKDSLASKDIEIDMKTKSLSESQNEIVSLQTALSNQKSSAKNLLERSQNLELELNAQKELSQKLGSEIRVKRLENKKLVAAASAPTCQNEKRQIKYLQSKVEVCEKTLLGDIEKPQNSLLAPTAKGQPTESITGKKIQKKARPQSLSTAQKIMFIEENLYDTTINCDTWHRKISRKSEMFSRHEIVKSNVAGLWKARFFANDRCKKGDRFSVIKGVCHTFGTNVRYRSKGNKMWLVADKSNESNATVLYDFEPGIAKYRYKRDGKSYKGFALLCN